LLPGRLSRRGANGEPTTVRGIETLIEILTETRLMGGADDVKAGGVQATSAALLVE
jgi:hypothetical protein